MGTESEFQPGSRNRVLKNLLGIRSVREMERAESDALLDAADKAFNRYSETHRFTVADICAMHREWLGGIYSWAGEYRQVNVTKDGFPFAAANFIPRLMNDFEIGPLRTYTPCRDVSGRLEPISHAMSAVHAELVLIHPFREGNGRCARLLASLMSLQAGLPPLDFGGIRGIKKREYIAAVQRALSHEYQPMTNVFLNVIRRTLHIYGEKQPF